MSKRFPSIILSTLVVAKYVNDGNTGEFFSWVRMSVKFLDTRHLVLPPQIAFGQGFDSLLRKLMSMTPISKTYRENTKLYILE